MTTTTTATAPDSTIGNGTAVLVAGATGMLGSRIAAHLLDQTDGVSPPP